MRLEWERNIDDKGAGTGTVSGLFWDWDCMGLGILIKETLK